MQECKQSVDSLEQFDLNIHSDESFGEHRSAGWG
jgi:hypothetical protein